MLIIQLFSLYCISIMMRRLTCYPADISEICLTFAQHLGGRFKRLSPPPIFVMHFCMFALAQATHEGQCDFMIIPCPSCKELLRANELERHNERECPERTLNCKYCKEPFHFKNIKVNGLVFSQDVCSIWAWLWDKARMLEREIKKAVPLSLGPRWDLSKISNDLWRLCQEENSQREGE